MPVRPKSQNVPVEVLHRGAVVNDKSSVNEMGAHLVLRTKLLDHIRELNEANPMALGIADPELRIGAIWARTMKLIHMNFA
jgi:hypothetical protein